MRRLCPLLTILALASPAAAAAEPETPPARTTVLKKGGARVRPYDSRSAAVLVEGLRRSHRLRALITELERHNVIVYVHMQPYLKGRLAGSMTWLTASGQFRYVRVALNPELRGAIAIATLAHELQHALEVANEPSIVDASSLNAYYRRNGISTSPHRNGWDTEAARTVGDEVRQDLAGGRSGRNLESLRDFDPSEWQVVYRRPLDANERRR